tara:strand:+ start:1188 stop:1634 length:447 start_codon:yes stop_codon:yes gene_type:complete
VINIDLINDYFSKITINDSQIKFLYNRILKNHKIKNIELSLILSNRNYLNQLKIKYFNQNYYTDVIAFNLNNQDEDIIGEIYVSIDDIKQNAKKFNVTFNDEFKRIIIHGLLHIIGYNDDTQNKKKLMTSLENKYMLLIDDEIIELKC